MNKIKVHPPVPQNDGLRHLKRSALSKSQSDKHGWNNLHAGIVQKNR
jgi:hypothetical protein